MEVRYKNKEIEEVCTNSKIARIKYGLPIAGKIKLRISELIKAKSVDNLIQNHVGRCHRLIGDRAGQYAIDLAQPYRLIFIQKGNEIQFVEIQEITDYH